MPARLARRSIVVLAAATALLGAADAQAASTDCTRYASPAGSDAAAGTQAAPFRTAQKLIDATAPGEVGCLLSGTYDQEVTGPYVARFGKAGTASKPITLRSAPGEDAKLRGLVYVPSGSDNVTIADLSIDGRRKVADTTISLQVLAANTRIEDNEITNHGNANCMVLGVPGWGRADGTVVSGNTFHDCGTPNDIYEHSIYVEAVDAARITDNVFLRSGGYAVHLYPDAQGVKIDHNVMVGGSGGVIFAGEGSSASSNNVVEQNLIAGTTDRPGIESWYGGRKGTGNVARSNCLSGNKGGDVATGGGGFTASGNVSSDPGFVAAGSGDYRMASTSGGSCLAAVGYDTVRKLLAARGTTPAPSTPAPSTPAPSTPAPSTPAPSTPAPSTPAPSTPAPSTPAPSTPAPSTPAPSTPAPSTPAPSTPAPSTPAPTNPAPTNPGTTTPAKPVCKWEWVRKEGSSRKRLVRTCSTTKAKSLKISKTKKGKKGKKGKKAAKATARRA